MQKITEQQIQAMAPNAAAAANGKKISRSGGFVRLQISADGSFYMGECTGSGKSNYITSVDFLNPENPVCRCTCPSRQFPCKHGLALLYEIMENKSFEICEIPEDILKKREKKEKAHTGAANTAAPASPKAPSKSSLNARKKKLQTQLDGLALTEKLIQDLMGAGLGTMGGTALKTYEDLVRQLGDYYLPGPQRLLNGLLSEIRSFQKDGKEIHYDNAIAALEKLWTLLKKSRDYLESRLADEGQAQDDSLLYEELGGVWKMAELEALGRVKKNNEFLQLAFWVSWDEGRREYIDISCWSDLSDGQLYLTKNYRPLKALKHIKEENSIFGVAYADTTVYYPGEGNPRIRWDSRMIQPAEPEHLEAARAAAAESLAAEIKNAKNLLKNPMAEPMLLRLIKFETICRVKDAENQLVLVNSAGENILLGDMPGMEETTLRIAMLPQERIQNPVMLGGFWYDQPAQKLKLQPISILTETQVIRLLY